jgi:hypothetical protein
MAGDWIKIEDTLSDKPEVIRMATDLHLDPDAVVGKLVRLWIWADQHSVTGSDMTITEAWLNLKVNCKKFAAAMRHAGWLTGTDGALTFPNFDRHNGKTAKTRAMENRKKAAQRERDKHPNPIPANVPLPSGQNTGHHRDQTGGPEKRREENIQNTLPPPGAAARPEGWPETEEKARQCARELGLNETLAANVWLRHASLMQWPAGGTFADAVKLKDTYRKLDGKDNPSASTKPPTHRTTHAAATHSTPTDGLF